MSESPKDDTEVSIIVPMFHGTGYLGSILRMAARNIESAANIGVELILVNDSPSDVPDFSIVSNCGFPVHVVLNDKNMGIQQARLRGVENSCGRYLFFLDQDDEIADDTVKRLYEDVNGGEIAVSDWELETLHRGKILTNERIAKTDQFSLKRICCGGNIIGPPGHCLIRRDCLPKCWLNRILKINGADDYFLWLGVLAEGRKFTHCDGKLYVHKYHEECFSNDILNMLASEEEAFRIAVEVYDIPTLWQWRHARSIRYRKSISDAAVKDSGFRRRICLLKYPEILLSIILNKLGIHV